MKTCPVCDTDYPDQHATCPTDGAVLIGSRELALGSLVRGKYRIVRKLGEGGMGIVYLADDILLGVRVALKFLAGDLGKDPRFIKRFRTEARAAYQLRHPNIVEVTNLDQAEDGSLFIAMEFVEGESLRSAIQSATNGLTVPRSLQIARGIASGLAAAHAQGTIHRDIKPENILLVRAADGHERPKLLDFGIAAVAESVTKLTRTRGFLLTPDYAAPEQWLEIAAEDMDGRTDLYALGCVFYEMLTGSTPFHAHNTSGWMKQHLEEIPKPPSLLRPDEAAKLYEQACTVEGHNGACNRLGYMYEDQRGVPRDYSRALALYTKACDTGNREACFNSGRMYHLSIGVPKDDPRAATLFSKACNGNNGYADSCALLGSLYRYGNGVEADPEKAKQLLAKGCNLGSQWGCTWLNEMQH